jgi:hypothetical protein
MRSFIVGLALVAASTPALAMDKGVEDMLRVTSASAAIIQFCSARYAVDTEFAMGFGKAASEVAYKALGPVDGKTEMLGEMSRRFEEVKAMGEDRWCRAERALYREQGVPIFKN